MSFTLGSGQRSQRRSLLVRLFGVMAIALGSIGIAMGGAGASGTVTVNVLGNAGVPLTGGTVTGEGTFNLGDTVTLTATPDAGKSFPAGGGGGVRRFPVVTAATTSTRACS